MQKHLKIYISMTKDESNNHLPDSKFHEFKFKYNGANRAFKIPK